MRDRSEISSVIEPLEKRQLLSGSHPFSLGGTGLTGEYFQGTNFNVPRLTRTDPKITFKWGNTKPDPTFGDGGFSVRWTGEIATPTSGLYTLAAFSNSGARLVVDGTTVFDNLSKSTRGLSQGSVFLTSGSSASITLEFSSPAAGQAPLQLLWKGPGTGGLNVVPRGVLFPAPTTPALPVQHGLTGTYYRGSKFQTQVVQRIDPTVNYYWPGPVTPDHVIASYSHYSATFTGQIVPLYSETYTFSTTSDDGVTLTINGQELVNDPHQHLPRSNKGTIALVAGQKYDIRLTYFENSIPPARVKLAWSSASQKKQVVPTSALYSAATAPNAPMITAVATTGAINLSWNDVSGETGFVLQRSTDGTNFTTLSNFNAGVTTFSDTTVAAGTRYFYQVFAVNGLVSSPASNVASAIAAASVPSFASETTIYGLTTGSALVYSLNTGDGSVTQIGSLSFGTNAAGRDPLNGDFYYTSTGTSSVDLAEWNPRNGQNTLIRSNIAVTGNVLRAAFRSDGAFFITAGNGDLFQVNVSTGVATAKGTIMDGSSSLSESTGDMAFAPDGTLYLDTGSSLYAISSTTISSSLGASSSIAATLVGTTGAPSLQLAFGQNGILFGSDTTGQLYTLDLSTAVATTVGTPSGIGMGDLASVPLYADLSATQSVTSLVRGSSATYTLSVTNAGPNATNAPVTVVDTLPAGVTFIAGSGNGWSFSASGQTVTATYAPTLASGAPATPVTLNVAVGSSVASSVTNTVAVSTTIFDGNTANNTNSLTSAVS